MTVLRRSATCAVATFALIVAGPALTAHAAPKYRFETLVTTSGGKVQACRIPTKASRPVTIKLRVDARTASSKVSGLGRPTRSGTGIRKGWESGVVRKGHVSSVGTIRVPRGAAYGFDVGIGTGQSGNGASFKVAAIRTCH